MKKYIIFILFLFNQFVEAQNIVTNGSFEKYSVCPDGPTQLNRAIGWHGIWGGGGSCEYYNSCATNQQVSTPYNQTGYQPPRTGKGYIGYGFYGPTLNHVEEFSANDLKVSLQQGVTYRVQLFLSLAHGVSYAISEIGVHITDSINADSIYNGLVSPEVVNSNGFIYDTVNWVKVEELYTAKGGESHIVIGCFKPNAKDTLLDNNGGIAVYYLVEDVAIYPIDAPIAISQCISDTTLCLGNSIRPGLTQVESQYKAEYEWLWYKAGHPEDTLSIEEFPVFQPDTTTTYVLKLRDFKYDVTYDTVSVTVVDCKTPTNLKVFPNPTNEKVFFEFDSTIPEQMSIDVYNLMGQKIKGLDYRSSKETNRVELNLQTQANGIYFYRIIIENEVKFNGKIVKI
jgi:hypothetical protein